MGRIRTLKPEHRTHRKIGPLSHIAYRLWVSCILEADDTGRLEAEPRTLRAQTFAFHDDVTVAVVEAALAELESAGALIRYASLSVHDASTTHRDTPRQYAVLPGWTKHQRIDRPKPAKYPPPPRELNLPKVLRSTINRRRVVKNGAESYPNLLSEKNPPIGPPTASNGHHPPEWPDDLREVREHLDRREVPATFGDPAYWRRIDDWLGAEDSGVAYLVELDKYLAWWEGQTKAHRPRDHRRAFRNWLAKAERWSMDHAQRQAQAAQSRQPFRRR